MTELEGKIVECQQISDIFKLKSSVVEENSSLTSMKSLLAVVKEKLGVESVAISA